ncbi:MAG: carbohydrate-binding family 9-like protein [Myxococcaceae bacterium]|nr:carbohydrate-binding family 9-like protein [Myxococcaceae bacterium]MCA3016323.1 carbohydrate-binding family 9-like protein [Myxococcaceae bacterium]
MRAAGWVIVVSCELYACRDEQAGPRPKAARPAAAVAPRGVPTVDAMPPVNFPATASWSQGAVRYLGSQVDPRNPQPGQRITLKHYFRAEGAQPRSYQWFLHFVDASSGQMLGNLDQEMQASAPSLGTWPEGKTVEIVQQLQMPTFDGAIRMLFGFWNEQGRLPVDAEAAHDGANRALGPLLEGPRRPLPEYRMPRAARPPVIDGALDDEAWKAAPEVTLGGSLDGHPISERRTRVRLVWDDTHVYVAFDCEDPDVWGSLRNKDDPIYNEDVAEVFFDADGDGATYNELQVSPHNVNFDASFVARRSDLPTAMKWESGMKSAVKVRGTLDDDSDRDDGWSAELAIPIAQLNQVPHVPPRKGDVWRFNAYRLEHYVRRQQIDGQAFSPLFVGDFHALPRFGTLVFD